MADIITAQVDPRAEIRRLLDRGNCKGAQKYYDDAIEVGLIGSRDYILEQQIADCKGEPVPSPPRDDNGDALTFTVRGVTFTMKYVEGGTFQMGGNDTESDDDEKPIHSVTLSSYYICETEVTQALWKAVMGTAIWQQREKRDPSYEYDIYGEGDNCPMYYVNYNEIVDEFLPELNHMTGMKFRLPTEAEWEYAARGGKKNKGFKYAGGDRIEKVAWYGGNSEYRSHGVAQKQPNELGLYDMSGNVWEWCSDWFGSYSSDAQANPKGPANGLYRVLRGGSWNSNAGFNRVSYRGNGDPSGEGIINGFRLALSELETSQSESQNNVETIEIYYEFEGKASDFARWYLEKYDGIRVR